MVSRRPCCLIDGLHILFRGTRLSISKKRDTHGEKLSPFYGRLYLRIFHFLSEPGESTQSQLAQKLRALRSLAG